MAGIAVNPAADVNLEPQNMPANSVEACPPAESTSLPDPAQFTDRVPMGAQRLAWATVATNRHDLCAAMGREVFRFAPTRNCHCLHAQSPRVRRERIKIPRVMGAILVMLAVLCG